jgi:polysaccharide biosynthesis/export protein
VRRRLGSDKIVERGPVLRFQILLLGVVGLAGCASREHPVPLNTVQSVPSVPEAQLPVTAGAGYRINALDQVRVDVFGEPELSLRDLTVDPDGGIVMPLAGRVEARGLTAEELSRRIAGQLTRYLRAPQVAVNVTQFPSRKVTVEGAVRTPGVFQAVDQMTLMDAIALGQGVGDYAKRDEVVVLRRQGAQRYIARFDLNAIETGRAADPSLQPGDVVVVGFSEARRRFSDAIALLPSAIGIFIALLPRF